MTRTEKTRWLRGTRSKAEEFDARSGGVPEDHQVQQIGYSRRLKCRARLPLAQQQELGSVIGRLHRDSWFPPGSLVLHQSSEFDGVHLPFFSSPQPSGRTCAQSSQTASQAETRPEEPRAIEDHDAFSSNVPAFLRRRTSDFLSFPAGTNRHRASTPLLPFISRRCSRVGHGERRLCSSHERVMICRRPVGQWHRHRRPRPSSFSHPQYCRRGSATISMFSNRPRSACRRTRVLEATGNTADPEFDVLAHVGWRSAPHYDVRRGEPGRPA